MCCSQTIKQVLIHTEQTSSAFTQKPISSSPAGAWYGLEVCATGPQLAEDAAGARAKIGKAGQKGSKTLHTERMISEGDAIQFSGRLLLAHAASFQ